MQQPLTRAKINWGLWLCQLFSFYLHLVSLTAYICICGEELISDGKQKLINTTYAKI